MEIKEASGFLRGIMFGSTYFSHIVAGINAGLFEGIAKYGEAGVTPETLARDHDYCVDYVRFWCELAYAIKILDYVEDGRFSLPEGFNKLLTAGKPGSMVGLIKMFEIGVKERFEHDEFMRTGAVRTWEDHIDQLSDAMNEVSAPNARVISENVYKRFPEIEQRLQLGIRLLDVGCGAGSIIMSLARQFPKSSFVGTDVDGCAIDMAEKALMESGLNNKIKFMNLDAEKLDFKNEFDMVLMQGVMHELRPEIRTKAVRNIYNALQTDGLLMSIDFLYPSSIYDYRKPEYLFTLMDQAMECVWGNRHLTKEELSDLFYNSGFQRREFHTWNYPHESTLRLTALAFK